MKAKKADLMKEGAKKSREKSYNYDSCIISVLRLLCLLIITVHFIASFFPKGRIWGINQWAYFPPLVTFPATFVALLFFLPPFSRFVLNGIRALMSPLYGLIKKKRHLWYLIFSLLFFVIFWMFKTETHFLGDGYQVLSNVESEDFAFKFTEPLESFLHLRAFHLARSLFNSDAETLYTVLSCVAGSVFIYLTLLFANFLGREKSHKVLAFLILVSMGSIQLFFGYVEHYTFLFLSIFGFLFLSLAYLEGKVKWIFPILALVLALSSHVSALYLLPSIFFLFLAKNERGKPQQGKRILLAILAVILLATIFLGYKKYSWSVPPLFVPLIHDRYTGPGYTLFSLAHLLDFLNQQLLVSSVGLILVLGVSFCRKGKILFTNSTSTFLLIVAASQLLFNFVIDPGLGASRDWDMFSAVGLGYTILGLYLLVRFFKDRIKFEYLAIILVVTSFHSTIPWIALNSDQTRSIERFRNLLVIDPKKSQNGHFILAKYFKSLGQEEEVEVQNDVQRQLLPELPLIADGKKLLVRGQLDSAEAKFLLAKAIAPRLAPIYDNLGMVYFAKGNLSKAEASYKQAIELGSFLSGPHFNLGNLYVVRKDMDKALEHYKKAVFLKVQFPEAYYNLGHIYFLKGEFEEAEKLFQKTLRLKTDFEDAYVGLGKIYKERGEFQRAVSMYQSAIKVKPDLAEAHLRLGMTLLYTGAREEAIIELERFLELAPQSQNVEQVQNILRELRQ